MNREPRNASVREIAAQSRGGKGGRTVYIQMRTMPINTAANTQTVQTFVESPLNRFAAVAAAMTIVVENS